MANFDEFIRTYFDPALTRDFASQCVLVINQAGGGASYAVGFLSYIPYEGPRIEGEDYRPYLSGVLEQLFNDRRWVRSPNSYPFNPDAADRLRVTITPFMPSRLDPMPAEAYVQVSVENLTWGGQFMLSSLDCQAMVLHGVGPGIGQQVPESLHVISLTIPASVPG